MIQFAYPLALLSLLAIPVLIVLHLLRPRPRRVVLSTTALWRAALMDRESATGVRRLPRNLSLWLLLASAAALGLALAGPQWLTRAGEDGDTVIVLDVSASMKTRSGIGTTRFDQAFAEANAIVDGLPRDGRMLVMTSGRKALLRSGFESDPGALRRVLARLRPGDEVGRPREALALALSLIRGRDRARIYFLTDGAFEPDVDPGSPQVVFRVVGRPARNVAITRFDLRQERAGEDRFQLLMTVRNYTDAPLMVPASASLDDRVLFSRSLELAAREEKTLVLPFPGRALGQAVARIDVDDDLAADNQAYAALDSHDPLRVLLLGRGNFYLESVLEALPGTELVRLEGSDAGDISRLARNHDVVVFDGIATPELPPGSFLLIDTVAPGLPFTDAGRVARPDILGGGQSALMRDVDLTAVRIEEARRVAVRGHHGGVAERDQRVDHAGVAERDQRVDHAVPGLQRLFWSRETDLGLALIDGDRKLIYLGFDLAGSNFPLQAAFPLFMRQSLEWLRPRATDPLSNHIAAGSAHSIPVPAGETRVIVRAPSGSTETLEVKGGAALFEATTVAGIYRYTVGDVTRFFAVSLADAEESDVNDRRAPGERREEAQARSDSAQALLPLWPWLLVLALALLALEWCVWIGGRARA